MVNKYMKGAQHHYPLWNMQIKTTKIYNSTHSKKAKIQKKENPTVNKNVKQSEHSYTIG